MVLDSSHLTLRMAVILLGWYIRRELLERRLDIIALDDFAQLGKKVRIRLEAVGTLPLGLITIVKCNFVLLGARLKYLPLVLLVEVDYEERMLEVNEEVALVALLVRRLI